MYQNINQISPQRKEMEPVEPVQMSIYQSNIYRKDLCQLHFNDEPVVQERQQLKDRQSWISHFVAYLTILSSNQGHQPRHDSSILCTALWQIYGDTENLRRKKLQRKNQGSNFLQGSFSNRDNVRAPIQFKRKSQPQHLK